MHAVMRKINKKIKKINTKQIIPQYNNQSKRWSYKFRNCRTIMIIW